MPLTRNQRASKSINAILRPPGEVRSRSHVANYDNKQLTEEEERIQGLFNRGSQVETVQALRAIYKDSTASQSTLNRRKPKLNYIMERYAQKYNSQAVGRFPSVTPQLRQSYQMTQMLDEAQTKDDSLAPDGESTLNSQQAMISQLEMQKKITARLQNLKDLFENEEQQNKAVHDKFR